MILSMLIYSKSCIFCYMKDKMKSIKYILLFVIIIVFTTTLYPILFNKYEERFLFIRQLINILILIAIFNYISRSIKKYSFGIYKYYKLLGVKEIEIVIKYIKSRAFEYFLFFGLFFASVYAGNVIPALLCTAQFILYCNGFILLTYVLMHKPKYKTALYCFFSILCAGYAIYFLYRLADLIRNNMAIGELLLFFNNSILMNMHRVIFFEFNLYLMIAVTILIVFTVRKIVFLEDVSVIEESSPNRSHLWDTYFNRFLNRNRSGLLREMKIAFRNKENLLSYVLLFGVYVFCCWLFGYVPQLLFAVSLLCVLLANYGLEGIFLIDTGTFQLYKTCGGDFDGFLQNKIKVSVLINFVFFGAYTIKCIENSCAEEWSRLLLFQIINIGYWNTYYSYLYSRLTLTRTIFYEIKRMIALVIGLIPVVNLVLAIMYYMKGKRSWNCYVNNG